MTEPIEPEDQLKRRLLIEHCEQAAKLVATWPEWKRNILQLSGQPMMSGPRKPVVGQG